MNAPLVLLLLLALPVRAGLTAEFRNATGSDTRSDRIPALLVDAGTPPTPFLDPGPFEVTWTGKLVVAERLRLHFSFAGEGEATLTLNGEEALAESGTLGGAKSGRIRLNPGEHELVIRYRSNDDGSARFRVYWEERSFPLQSIPPTAFGSAGPVDSAKRRGRELFAAAHCAKCHLAADGLGGTPMGEMQEIAPLLADTGGRLNPQWIAEWIADPKAWKPDTRMPSLVDASTDEGRQQAADLAAWLAAMQISEPPPGPDPALAPKGGELFHELGCAACHDRPDAREADPDRIPLRWVRSKFRPGALVSYLKEPDRWDPHTGMPDFHLSDDEAAALAAWILASCTTEREGLVATPGDATRGAGIAAELNCGSCHAGLPMNSAGLPSLQAIFGKDWSTEGCASARATGELPFYDFSGEERSDLSAFAASGSSSLFHHVPAEFAARKLESLRCTSCHSIDGKAPLLSTTHAESSDLVVDPEAGMERLDQSRPQLTYIGEMLHSSYIRRTLDGAIDPRPWLAMRMPAYSAHAAPLSDALARLHGVEPGPPGAFEPDPGLARTGQLLVGADGFGCTTCHGIGDEAPTSAFEVKGINFALTHERLRREWYDRWMANPLSVTPDTKMPVYSERGETSRSDILDGDASRQFEAIWHYLLSPGTE